MTVKELKPSQRVAGRWLVVLEDGSIVRVGESEVLDFALYAGRELSDGELEGLKQAAHVGGLKEKTLALLSRKPMSRRELERRLKEWEAGGEEAAAICDRMEELGYLDDGRYAQTVVKHYSAKGFGEKKLRDELYRRGVPRELWEEALTCAADPAAAIDAFVAKALGGAVPDRKQLQKVSAALARRGYSWQDVSDALRRYGAETGEGD